jgi:ABC-type Fe3+-hydroxamate transport system substrate-binding protein
VYINTEEKLRRHADAIAEVARVDVSEPKSVEDVRALIARLAAAHGRDASGVLRELDEAVDRLKPVLHFSFAVPIWKEPWMWCGGDTYVSRLVECAGGVNVLREKTRYPQMALDEVLALKPDVVFLPDEPYLFTRDDAAAIDAKTIGPFPGHLFTWHGTRTILGLRFLRDEVPRPEAP